MEIIIGIISLIFAPIFTAFIVYMCIVVSNIDINGSETKEIKDQYSIEKNSDSE